MLNGKTITQKHSAAASTLFPFSRNQQEYEAASITMNQKERTLKKAESYGTAKAIWIELAQS